MCATSTHDDAKRIAKVAESITKLLPKNVVNRLGPITYASASEELMIRKTIEATRLLMEDSVLCYFLPRTKYGMSKA